MGLLQKLGKGEQTKLDALNPDVPEKYQRIMEVIVDPGLYLASKGRMFTGNKKRTLPNAYRFFTDKLLFHSMLTWNRVWWSDAGSPHVILSRKLVEFAILGWDNLPRKLLLFFSNTKYSQRDYFQTLACNSKDFSKTVVNSNLRFTVYEDDPPDLSVTDLEKMLSSGAAFAGNFRANNPVLDKIDSLDCGYDITRRLVFGWARKGPRPLSALG
ncbi:hypothetical protein HYC85_000675 [Camellia sinensis]|uniref:Uncharacterized protein n=1 Tax=Camellia sinensis TaxID=4442 RepID=A0A7J7I4P8_CAMSI|nr:hypothetical protein HYC85_000675 [Camellia sinensis]